MANAHNEEGGRPFAGITMLFRGYKTQRGYPTLLKFTAYISPLSTSRIVKLFFVSTTNRETVGGTRLLHNSMLKET